MSTRQTSHWTPITMIPRGFTTDFHSYLCTRPVLVHQRPRARCGTARLALTVGAAANCAPMLYHTEWYVFDYPPLLELNPIILEMYSLRMHTGDNESLGSAYGSIYEEENAPQKPKVFHCVKKNCAI